MSPIRIAATVALALLLFSSVGQSQQPRSEPADAASSDAEASPWEELDAARPERRDPTTENLWLSAYSLSLLGLGPVGISAFQTDIGYGEGALITAAGALGAASVALGGALLGGGVVLTYVGWLAMEIGVEAPLLGILLVPTGLVMMAIGVGAGITGGALVFGSTVITVAGMHAADDAIGQKSELTFGLGAAVSGGLLLGTLGGALLISQSNAEPWLQTVAVVVSGMFGASLAYGVFRHAEGGQGPAMVVFTPVVSF